MSATVILASSDVGTLLERLDHHTNVVFVPTAANGLPDRHAMVEPVRQVLGSSGARWQELDLANSTPDGVATAVGRADAVLVGGGNPYLVLDEARRTGFDDALHELTARGGTYCGISAGAMLVAPSLEPLRHFAPSPTPPDGADLDGVGLVDLLVLPHTDRDGRRAKHEATLAACGGSHRLVPLNDGECVIVDDQGWRIEVRPGLDMRPAVPSDAEAVTALFVESGQITLEPARWTDRIEAGEPENLVVATFYTHPRVWGTGVGQRLTAYGLDRLRSMGYDRASRVRDFHGFPITELRHRYRL